MRPTLLLLLLASCAGSAGDTQPADSDAQVTDTGPAAPVIVDIEGRCYTDHTPDQLSGILEASGQIDSVSVTYTLPAGTFGPYTPDQRNDTTWVHSLWDEEPDLQYECDSLSAEVQFTVTGPGGTSEDSAPSEPWSG